MKIISSGVGKKRNYMEVCIKNTEKFMVYALRQTLKVFGGIFVFLGAAGSISPTSDNHTRIVSVGLLITGILFITASSFIKKVSDKRDMEIENAVDAAIVEIHNNNIDPISNCSLLLKDGEKAYHEMDTFIQETKTKAVGSTGSGAGVSVRVAKGVYLHSGSSGRKTIYKDVKEKYQGKFVITNKRVAFINEKHGFDIPIQKITSVYSSGDFLTIQSGKKSYNIYVSKPRLFIELLNNVQSFK